MALRAFPTYLPPQGGTAFVAGFVGATFWNHLARVVPSIVNRLFWL